MLSSNDHQDIDRLVRLQCKIFLNHVDVFIITLAGQKKCERKSFQFLNDEIPIRLAHIMREFEDLPKELLTMKSVKLVRSW